jgi:hypothetical protein
MASGLLKTLTPSPPITPRIEPMLICRTARGFAAPDCVMTGVCASCEYWFRRSPSLASGSGESQRMGRVWRYWYARSGALRTRGEESIRPLRRPGSKKDMVAGVAGVLVRREECWRWRYAESCLSRVELRWRVDETNLAECDGTDENVRVWRRRKFAQEVNGIGDIHNRCEETELREERGLA